VLEQVTLADVVAGRLPVPVSELAALEDSWRSFGDDAAPATDTLRPAPGAAAG
jgi:hypothetical protein